CTLVPPLRLSRRVPPPALGHLGERELTPLCTPVPSSTAPRRGGLCRGGIRAESTPRLPRHGHATGTLDAVAQFGCDCPDLALAGQAAAHHAPGGCGRRSGSHPGEGAGGLPGFRLCLCGAATLSLASLSRYLDISRCAHCPRATTSMVCLGASFLD